MTRERRIAIGEIIRVVAVLTKVNSPLAKQIVMMLLGRVTALAEGAGLEVASDDDVKTLLAFAKTLENEPQPNGGASEAGA